MKERDPKSIRGTLAITKCPSEKDCWWVDGLGHYALPRAAVERVVARAQADRSGAEEETAPELAPAPADKLSMLAELDIELAKMDLSPEVQS